jgi:hypothetical protein
VADRIRVYWVIATLLICWSAAAAAASASADSRSSGSQKSLQAKAADPTEPLIQMSVFNDLLPDNRKGAGAANQVLLQPVAPIPPLAWFPVGQIVRPSVSIITTPGPDRTTTVGDITLFDLFIPERPSWGSWGLGPVFVFPTAGKDRVGAEKWQVGPAGTLIYEGMPHLQVGVLRRIRSRLPAAVTVASTSCSFSRSSRSTCRRAGTSAPAT